MQRDVNDNISSHPSDKELAHYIDNKLDKTAKAKIVKHLIECDECSDAVALVLKHGQKKTSMIEESEKEQEAINNINYKGALGALSGVVALFIIFIAFQQQPVEVAIFKAPTIAPTKEININESIKRIKASTNLTYLKLLDSFQQTKKYLKQKDYDNAREYYSIALIDIEEDSNLKKIEKKRLSIIINYYILLLSREEGDKESEKEYIDKLKDDIRRLKIREKNKNL